MRISRQLLKRYLPDARTIRDHWFFRRFAHRLRNANLWVCNRRSVSRAAGIGLFVAFLPVPFQMVIVALASILLRANLSIAMMVIFVTNPVTMAPMFFFAYRVGVWLLATSVIDKPVEVTLHWFLDQMQHIWLPLIVGSLFIGTALALLGMIASNCAWRLHVIRKYKRRKRQRMRSVQISLS